MSESNVFNCDCMEGIRALPDKFFDLCVADPPYGISITARHYGEAAHTHTHTQRRSSAEPVDRSAVCGSFGKGRPPIGGVTRMKGESASSKCRLNFTPCSTIAPRRTRKYLGSWSV